MAAIDPHRAPRPGLISKFHHWAMGLAASPGFQGWAAQFPLTRRIAKRDGERLFDLVSGFAYSQTLLTTVELGLLEALRDAPKSCGQLASMIELDADRTEKLCQAAAALDLIKRRRDGSYQIARLGAASLGVPGLQSMIRHHAVFYRDLADPVALLRGETQPELAEFWPYVRGETAKEIAQDTAATYSDLMAQTQQLVAEETLRTVALSGVSHLMDVGGGIGAFQKAVRAQYPGLELSVLDLPSVVAELDLSKENIAVRPGSFLDPLPGGADAISLIRVLYDHSDDTIMALLRNIFQTLPDGGRLIVSEPMSGGTVPTRPGDVYFSLYTMAMTTGRVRSAEDIKSHLAEIGFENIKIHPTSRPFVTTCLSAVRPA